MNKKQIIVEAIWRSLVYLLVSLLPPFLIKIIQTESITGYRTWEEVVALVAFLIMYLGYIDTVEHIVFRPLYKKLGKDYRKPFIQINIIR